MKKRGADKEYEVMSQLLQAVDMAVKSGVKPNMVADVLIDIGWPAELVNPAVDAWLQVNVKRTVQTDFKTWLKKYQKKATKGVVTVVIVTTISAGISLLKPWPMKIMADSAFGSIPAPWPLTAYTGEPALIAYTAIMSILIFLFGAAFNWISAMHLQKVAFSLNRSIKTESFLHILHLPLFHQQRLAKGDYVYRQNVVTNSLSDLVLDTTSSIIGSIIMIMGVLAIMFSFNPRLTIVSVVLMPMLYVTMKLIGPHLGKYSRQLTELNSKTASSINEAVDNAETVQTFTLEDKQLLQVDNYWRASYEASRKNLIWGNLLENSNSLLVILATSTVMYFGGTEAMQGKMTFGELFIFMTYMGYLLGPVENLVKKITTRYQKEIDVSRIYEVLSDHEGVEFLRKGDHIPAGIRPVIQFDNVSYSYGGKDVFKNLNITIREGEKVGIIGPSGGGKSTVLKLLPLFIEPDQGRILLGGYDTQSFSLQELRRQISWVSQTPQLFSGTIAENIYDGDVYRRITSEEVMNAVEVSNVLEFLVKTPLGINTLVGENGSSLSGGQRQRVAIARALIKNAPILCLDEPTAALDVKSENYIRDALSRIVTNKTVLMVTHRKALLSLMDTIYVLDNGTLTNVNELGGLDYYLTLLEGIAIQQAEKEIVDEKSYVLPNAVDTQIGIQDMAVPEARQTNTIQVFQEIGSSDVEMPSRDVFFVPHSSDQTTGRSSETDLSMSDEVVVEFHHERREE